MAKEANKWYFVMKFLRDDLFFSAACVGVSGLILGVGYLKAFPLVNAALAVVLAVAFSLVGLRGEARAADTDELNPTALQYLLATFVDFIAGLLVIAAADLVPPIDTLIAIDLVVFQTGLLYLIARNSAFTSIGFLLFRIKLAHDGSFVKRIAVLICNMVMYIPVFVFWFSRGGYSRVEKAITVALITLFILDLFVLFLHRKRALHRLFGIKVVKELRYAKPL